MIPAIIDGYEVIASGTFVVAKGQSLVINPIPIDRDFKLKLSVSFFEEYPEGSDKVDRLKTDADPDTKTTTITLHAKYFNGITITTSNTYLFAADENYLYFINIWFRSHGDIDTFTTAFDLTIYQGPNQ